MLEQGKLECLSLQHIVQSSLIFVRKEWAYQSGVLYDVPFQK
jgi:hypothetical protein